MVALCTSFSSVQSGPNAAPADAETRALWVLRTSLTTPESIETLVRAARDHGFNTLLVQVRGRGDAYSPSISDDCARVQRASFPT